MSEVRKDLFIGVSFLVAALILVSFALAVQAQASQGEDDSVSSDTSVGIKLRGDGTVDDTQPNAANTTQTTSLKLRGDGTIDDDQPGMGAEVQAQNQIKLRGDGTVDDSSNEADEDEASDDDSNSRESERGRSEERRGAVVNFVQSLLRVADRQEGGLGEQVRAIAREQEASSERALEARARIEQRSRFRTFLFGSDYKNLGALRSEVVQTQNRLRQLNQTLSGVVAEEEKLELQSQIQAVMEEQMQLEAFVQTQEAKISLFGWLTKFFNK